MCVCVSEQKLPKVNKQLALKLMEEGDDQAELTARKKKGKVRGWGAGLRGCRAEERACFCPRTPETHVEGQKTQSCFVHSSQRDKFLAPYRPPRPFPVTSDRIIAERVSRRPPLTSWGRWSVPAGAEPSLAQGQRRRNHKLIVNA